MGANYNEPFILSSISQASEEFIVDVRVYVDLSESRTLTFSSKEFEMYNQMFEMYNIPPYYRIGINKILKIFKLYSVFYDFFLQLQTLKYPEKFMEPCTALIFLI